MNQKTRDQIIKLLYKENDTPEFFMMICPECRQIVAVYPDYRCQKCNYNMLWQGERFEAYSGPKYKK